MRVSVSLTVPAQVLNAQNVINEIARVQRSKTAPEVRRLFQRTVVGWQNPPAFNYTQNINNDSIGVTTFSSGRNSDQYALVNLGSPPHPIDPINPGGLRFQRGYRSSTRPRILYSRPFVRSGPFSLAWHVSHPGFEAREFDAEIADLYTDTFRDDMQDAMNRGAQMP